MTKKIAKKKHTTVGIRWWSPTQLLVYRSEACVWQSGRDAQFSSVYGRMWQMMSKSVLYRPRNSVPCTKVAVKNREITGLGSPIEIHPLLLARLLTL